MTRSLVALLVFVGLVLVALAQEKAPPQAPAKTAAIPATDRGVGPHDAGRHAPGGDAPAALAPGPTRSRRS
jgi:hypothetical protein